MNTFEMNRTNQDAAPRENGVLAFLMTIVIALSTWWMSTVGVLAAILAAFRQGSNHADGMSVLTHPAAFGVALPLCIVALALRSVIDRRN